MKNAEPRIKSIIDYLTSKHVYPVGRGIPFLLVENNPEKSDGSDWMKELMRNINYVCSVETQYVISCFLHPLALQLGKLKLESVRGQTGRMIELSKANYQPLQDLIKTYVNKSKSVMDKLKINPSSPEQRLIVLVSKVNLLLSYFETADLTCEGLFRLPGSKKQIVKLEISFVSDSLSVFRSKIEKSTINDTASILKHIIDKMIPAMPESWYLGFKDLKKN